MRGYDETVADLIARAQAAFVWDVARRRVAFANDAGLAFWGETSLAELQAMRPRADDPRVEVLSGLAAEGGIAALPSGLRLSAAHGGLRDGRPGLIVDVLPAEEKAPPLAVLPSPADLFAAAPVAMALFDAGNARVLSNTAAEDLLIPGGLADLLGGPGPASALRKAAEGRESVTRRLACVTRFGLSALSVTAKPQGGGLLLVAFEETAEPGAPAPAPLIIEVVKEVPAEPVAREAAPAAGAALDEVVAALVDATLAADENGRIIAMNARAARLLGESARGEPLMNILPAELKADAAAYLSVSGARGLEKSLEEGRETRIARDDADGVPVRAVFARLATGDILVQFRDLSSERAQEDALKRAREEAETASQHKTDFLAKVSHELRTPLNAVIGFAEMMDQERLGPLGNEKYKGYVRDIYDSGRLVLSLINDLLDLSKAESGRVELEPDAVEIQPIVQSVLSLLGPLADKFNVTLIPAVQKNLPAIVADERSLKQILINLGSNAIKYSRDGGTVEFGATLDQAGAVHILVRDDGRGMSESDLKKAMQPYGRARGRGREREGTGLGLPLAKALTEANKAQFAIQSADGKGTIVRITFPTALVLAG